MADKPIIKIAIDSAEFDAFTEKFKAYQDMLDNQPEAWKATNKEAANMYAAVAASATTFQDFHGQVVSPRLEDGFRKVAKNSKETEGFWRKTSKEIERSSKFMTGLARMSIDFATFGKTLGAIGGLGMTIFGGTVKAATDLGRQNAQNRRLGLKPGEEQSFDIEYKKAGGDSELLAKIAEAKSDPTKWAGLQAIGISAKDIMGLDTPHLAAQFLEKGGAKYNSMGVMGATWARDMHVTDFMDPLGLKQAGTYNHEDYQKMQGRYETKIKDYAVAQDTLDKMTEAQAKFEAEWEKVTNQLKAALLPLLPVFTELAKDVADAIAAYAKSEDLRNAINDTIQAFKDVYAGVKWVADKLNSLFGLDKGNVDDQHLFTSEKGSGGEKFFEWTKNALPKGWVTGDKGSIDYPSWVPGWLKGGMKPALTEDGRFKPAENRAAYFSELEKQHGLKPGTLDTIEEIESARGQHNTGKKTKYGQAMGPFQFMEDTAKQYGVYDRFDEKQAAGGAARMLKDLLKRYNGDYNKAFAAYNWGAGNVDKDVAKNKEDWKDHLPGETGNYLEKAAKAGVAKASSIGNSTQSYINDELAKLSASISKLSDRLGTPPWNEGGGAKYRTPDKSHSSSQSRHQIDVNVSTPAGARTAVTGAGLPQ